MRGGGGGGGGRPDSPEIDSQFAAPLHCVGCGSPPHVFSQQQANGWAAPTWHWAGARPAGRLESQFQLTQPGFPQHASWHAGGVARAEVRQVAADSLEFLGRGRAWAARRRPIDDPTPRVAVRCPVAPEPGLERARVRPQPAARERSPVRLAGRGGLARGEVGVPVPGGAPLVLAARRFARAGACRVHVAGVGPRAVDFHWRRRARALQPGRLGHRRQHRGQGKEQPHSLVCTVEWTWSKNTYSTRSTGSLAVVVYQSCCRSGCLSEPSRPVTCG